MPESKSWREQSNGYWEGSKHQDEEWLRERYWGDGLSTNEMGELADVTPDTIQKWMHKHGIETRGRNESRLNYCDPSADLLEALDGMALGDGYIHRQNSGGGAYYQENDKHREYLEWLKSYFESLGVDGWLSEAKPGIWRYTSNKYVDLCPVWERWYPNGEKRIPGGFELTPTKVLFWYLGDGFYSHGEQQTNLGITGFDLSDGFDQLVSQLNDVGITSTQTEQGVGIWRESHEDFFEYVSGSGIDAPPGYGYKFP